MLCFLQTAELWVLDRVYFQESFAKKTTLGNTTKASTRVVPGGTGTPLAHGCRASSKDKSDHLAPGGRPQSLAGVLASWSRRGAETLPAWSACRHVKPPAAVFCAPRRTWLSRLISTKAPARQRGHAEKGGDASATSIESSDSEPNCRECLAPSNHTKGAGFHPVRVKTKMSLKRTGLRILCDFFQYFTIILQMCDLNQALNSRYRIFRRS